MKRFQFRLEGLLRVRRFELDRARSQWAAIEREWTRRAALADEERRRVASGQQMLERAAADGNDGEQVGLRADAVTAGRFRMLQAQQAVDALSGPREEARRRVDHAHARVRSLERLEEKAEAEHRRLALAAEQAELEELSIGRIARAGIEARRIQQEEAR
jgi:flagellar FliJ protein